MAEQKKVILMCCLTSLSTSFMQQFQPQPLLSSPQFSFKTSQRSGRHLLVVNGVTFFRNRHRNNKQYWKCNQYYKCKCPCIVVIDEINSRMNVKHIHNHDTSGASGGSRRNSLLPPILDPGSSTLAGSFLNDSLLVGGNSALAAAASFAQSVQSRGMQPESDMEVAMFWLNKRKAKKLLYRSTSRMGKAIITIDGYSFRKSCAKEKRIYWVCTGVKTKKCPARITTCINTEIERKYQNPLAHHIRIPPNVDDGFYHSKAQLPLDLRMVMGRTGRPTLLMGGHAFTRNNTHKNKTYWLCSKKTDDDEKAAEDNFYFVRTADGRYTIQEDGTSSPKANEKPPPPKALQTGTQIRAGFIFPITEGKEVERLETLVAKDPAVRQEYIEVLKRKPKGITIVAYMQNIFSDESLIGYNYNGVMVLGKRKRAMRVYEIFTNCFMDAYESEGLTQFELAFQLTLAIKQSRNRMRQRTFRARKTIKKICEKRK
ncbi:AAEL004635-PA [Aedes aegypti]|uniref:AAEL004635-PA n=1 Tax=Aedes aegypti TaxID=7159 RepID=Q17CB9_AEDAE|nr:AAEL004635-PA [Aedes aegypti]